MAAPRFNFVCLFVTLRCAAILRINAKDASDSKPCTLGSQSSLELRTKILESFPKWQSDIELEDQYSLTGFTLTETSSLNKIIPNKSEFFDSRTSLCAGRAKRISYIEYNAHKLEKLKKSVKEIVEADPHDKQIISV